MLILSNKKGKRSIRKAYGESLVELGKENNSIVVLDADLSCSTQTAMFAEQFPDRFFNMGIAEQDLMTCAAGLSLEGRIVFVSTFAMFATGRAWEQIRNTIAYNNVNVKIVATHGGVTVGEDGASHQALEDVAIMRSIPNMTVIIPCDYVETQKAIKFAAYNEGPVYIRLSRISVEDIFDEKTYKFEYNKATRVKDGKDLTIISNGETLKEVLLCAKILQEDKIDVEVLHMPFVKPIDEQSVIESARKTNFVVTVENHSIIGGLGAAVSQLLSEKYPVRMKFIGLNDEFGQSGPQDKLVEYYGLDALSLSRSIKKVISKL